MTMRSGATWIGGSIGLAAAVAILAWPVGGRAGVGAEEHEFVGVKKCASCHGKELYGDQVASWRRGPHARAYESLGTEKAAGYAKERGIAGSPQQAGECLDCHVTARGVAPERIKYDLDPEDGVQCESCHGAGQDYRKREIMADRDDAKAHGLVIPTADRCTTCHNDESPAWDPARYTLPDGRKVGFDFAQAAERIAHPTPADRKGRIIELEDAEKAKSKKRTVR